jgi:proline dehydrogenase
VKTLNRAIVNFVKILPKSVVSIFAKKYVAGTTLDDAIRVTKELNAKGIYTTIDVLGESIKNLDEAREEQKACMRVLEAIDKHGLKANLSIKPTSLGLAIDTDVCFTLVSELVAKAKEMNNFVRIDMEDSPYTDLTFELYKRLRETYSEKHVGVVVQAYLKRTYSDVEKLNPLGTNYRLCKGIYIEPEEIAYQDREEIRQNYLKVLDKMLTDGNYVGIATHDDYLIDNAYKMIKEKNVPKDKYEFQMLYGVRKELRDKINSDGHKIRIYVPFGERWYEYSIRRLQENPQVAWYITKAIFTRQ